MAKTRSLLLVVVLALFVVGCDSAAADESVSGTIVYRERIALPEDAVLTVRIQNASVMDASPEQTIVSEEIITTPGQVPIPYELAYDSADIDDRLMYSVSARIDDSDGNLLFINTTVIPVITLGNPTEDVEILVEKVGTSLSEAPPTTSVAGTIFYLARIALPADAVVAVRIQNESLMDAPPEQTIIGAQIIGNPGQAPIVYEVFYDSADINDQLSYGIRVRIMDGNGNLLFINTQPVPVITLGSPTVDVQVLVQSVAAVPTPPAVEATPRPTLPPALITAAAATIEAYLGTPTATPGQAPGDTSELVNATAAPDRAPVIINFFASDVPQDPNVRYNLNWDTQNATRVEIFGHVMDNPQTGSWPVYSDSDQWVLWAANDVAWVESVLQVQSDYDMGTTLSDVSVASRLVNISVRDPQYVDSDNINLIVNGIPLLQNYTLDGRFVTVPVNLSPGLNQVQIFLVDEGTTPTAVVEVQINNVTSGSAGQFSKSLRAGETTIFSITAP